MFGRISLAGRFVIVATCIPNLEPGLYGPAFFLFRADDPLLERTNDTRRGGTDGIAKVISHAQIGLSGGLRFYV